MSRKYVLSSLAVVVKPFLSLFIRFFLESIFSSSYSLICFLSEEESGKNSGYVRAGLAKMIPLVVVIFTV